MSYLLGIDSGTNACKAVLFDLEGRPVSSSAREHPIHYPKPTWAEQDPEWWWRAAAEAVGEALEKSKVDPGDIDGVGLDSQREAVVLVGRDGRSISNSIIWLDRRALGKVEEMRRLLRFEEVLERTGVPIDYIFSAAKLLWIRDEAPSLLSKAEGILFPKDYVAYRLTGEAATDYSMASRTMLFDIHKLKWDEEICGTLGLSMDLLPPVKGSWEVVGDVTPEAAEITGLKTGTPVVSGGGDRPCEALGAGVIEPGRVNIGTGTGTMVTTPLKEPRADPEGKVDCCCHVAPATWEYEVAIIATGASLRWFRDNFAYEEVERSRRTGVDPYDYMVELASKVPPGSEGLFYYPYPMGAKAPKFNDLAKGVFFGLTLGHSKAHFIRAILEGIAFQYAETLELFERLGVSIREASIVGGEAKSDMWNQMKADITGLKIWVPEVADAAALGSAILAGVGGGAYRDVKEGVRRAVRFRKAYNPNPETHESYRKTLEKYKGVYNHLEAGYRIAF
ncbi:MAG: xylulokinase [Candidatus Bathyarchaeia archaeon]